MKSLSTVPTGFVIVVILVVLWLGHAALAADSKSNSAPVVEGVLTVGHHSVEIDANQLSGSADTPLAPVDQLEGMP